MATTTTTTDAKHHECICVRGGGYHCECWRRGQERMRRTGYINDSKCGGQWCSHVRQHEAWIAGASARRAAELQRPSILDKLFAWAAAAARV